jgi:tRNA pseudouridine13 synthase
MKLKQHPDDFQVEEVTDLVPGPHGPFALYRLEKCGWSTPDAIAAVRRRWGLEPGRLSYGGLKDRHAATTQHFTVFHGPKRGLRHHDVTVDYLGQVGRPFTSTDIRCNRFRITLRDLPPNQQETITANLEQVRAEGVPNYFDDQRFGSVTGEGGEFIARLLVCRRFEDALRLALAGPYEHDRAEEKREKQILNEHWGDWAACKERLPRGHARSLVDYLRVHPTDFRGAVARLRPELRGLYLSAYQSHLWNRLLAKWLEHICRPGQLVRVALRLGEVPMHRGVSAELRQYLAGLMLPLPSARLKMTGVEDWSGALTAVLAEEGLSLRDLQVRGVREMFFSKGEQAAVCVPSDLVFDFAGDERHPGRRKLSLAFALPRGCYATLIVKRALVSL